MLNSDNRHTSVDEVKLIWQRFTERARKAVYVGKEEAVRLGKHAVSSEHLLLGLLSDEENVACGILTQQGISFSDIKKEVNNRLTRGDGKLDTGMQLSDDGKKVIDDSYEEASKLKNDYLGTEHLLLALIRSDSEPTCSVLSQFGVEYERTRDEVISLQKESK